ncbi:hypothetical protein HAX54_014252 [Datura stramonium]|uniref:Uncharacterized protein n=1 Tax=Datura stramonium TaxID=4076 RepID=A0ABS8TPL2_DATST|nr:hypothetical protein [Datura stramonium]
MRLSLRRSSGTTCRSLHRRGVRGAGPNASCFQLPPPARSITHLRVSPLSLTLKTLDMHTYTWNCELLVRGTVAAWEFLLQRDRYHGRKSAIPEQESGRWIHRGGDLNTIEGPLQQKSDRCSGQWESVSGF